MKLFSETLPWHLMRVFYSAWTKVFILKTCRFSGICQLILLFVLHCARDLFVPATYSIFSFMLVQDNADLLCPILVAMCSFSSDFFNHLQPQWSDGLDIVVPMCHPSRDSFTILSPKCPVKTSATSY